MSEIFHWQEKLGKTQTRVLRFAFQITGAKAVSLLPAGGPVLTTFDAIASQAVIDAHLETSGEFPLAAFDATSMGADTFACLINMAKQAAYVSHMEARLYDADGASTDAVGVMESDLAGGTAETALSIGASGNIAFKLSMAGLDAMTAGLLVVEVYWIAK